MRRLSPILALAILTTLAPIAMAKQKAAPITVTEKGVGTFTPRHIRSNGHFEGTATTASAALSAATTKAQKAQAALLALGIPAKAIRLEQPYVRQEYDRNGRPTQNFIASQAVTTKVAVKNFPLALQANDALAAAGGSVSGGPDYSEGLLAGAERRAKADAVKNARLQAEREAGKLGLKVGRVLSIGEIQSGGFGGGRRSVAMAESAMSGGGAPSTPTSFSKPEKVTIDAYRTVTFEVK